MNQSRSVKQYAVRQSVYLRLFAVLSIAFCFLWISKKGFSQQHKPPPVPAVRPFLAESYPNDTNLDHIDDQLLERAQQALVLEEHPTDPQARSRGRHQLDELVEVELVFKDQITQEQIDAFSAVG